MTEILGFLTCNTLATKLIWGALLVGFTLLHFTLSAGRQLYRAGE